jgi:DNA invertase Pin-like site-specific DNA recombinase
LVYARYSTEEQNPSAIPDQIAFCQQFLVAHGIPDADVEVFSDAEMSGELVSRPGIDQVRARVTGSTRPDVLLCEDSSRLFRHETACGELIEAAVDRGIRVLCLHDDVDTAVDDWEDPLHEALRHHARSNRYTSKRIKRRLQALWQQGAAIGLLRPGYRRKPTCPATPTEPAQGPFFDEIDPLWAPMVYGAFERVARHEPVWLVAQWLTAQGLPKAANASQREWTEGDVRALIHRTIYRGVEPYRATVARKQFRTGRHVLVANHPDQILKRDMAQLRIVPDWLWHQANNVLEERTTRKVVPRGVDHPLAGIPRARRGPLSGSFVCGVCGSKMYMDGRREGGYRCSQAGKGTCWNKATAMRSLVHARIGQAIAEQLLSLDGVLEALLAQVQALWQQDEPRKQRRDQLVLLIAEKRSASERLLDLLEQAEQPPELLLERLHRRQEELGQAEAELQRFEAELATPAALPSKAQLMEQLTEQSRRLLTMDAAAGVELRRLVARIEAIPHQQVGTQKVVLRARFQLRVAALLPEQVQGLLQGLRAGPLAGQVQTIPMSVDLFERSAAVRYGLAAVALQEAGLSLAQIGQQLGIGKRQAHLAAQCGKRLKQAGRTDAFVELTQAPPAASRWRTHRRLAPQPRTPARPSDPPGPPGPTGTEVTSDPAG